MLGMSLSKFVESSLIEIVKGVNAASEEVNKLGGAVVVDSFAYTESHSQYQIVEFDVAVFAENSGENPEGFAVSILGNSFSKVGETEAYKEQNHTRLSFKVPIRLPVGKGGEAAQSGSLDMPNNGVA